MYHKTGIYNENDNDLKKYEPKKTYRFHDINYMQGGLPDINTEKVKTGENNPYGGFVNAVYHSEGTPDATAATLAGSVDKFQDGTGVKYRYNTILNINDYKTTDGTVTDVAVVYVYGGPADASAAKANITNDFINGNNTGTTTEIDGTNYKLYKYRTGANGTVELTNKNRLQFVLTLKENQAVNPGTYSNVLAFTAYKCYNGSWKVSDNCVAYQNGNASIGMIQKSASAN